jgi:hypothetical protein
MSRAVGDRLETPKAKTFEVEAAEGDELTERQGFAGETLYPQITVKQEDWLGGRDSNPDNGVQSAVSYR